MAARFGTEVDGRLVEIEFDRRKVVLNAVRLFVDGAEVDAGRVFYGEKELRATIGGREVVVAVVSGMVGELLRAQVRRGDGAWVDLEERTPA
ncbi:hypothetical protein WCD74_16025 [Actinomycetospora sp. OC33-EN08]|uniref:Uncharacterized protein n=1 Tax=Actinomycetospora aurantiaca TaxID=3129233 RepID=A0ABU8MPN7_9PSEU